MPRIRIYIRLVERFVIYRILHADDTPHRLALGIALGIFLAWTPTIGFQMILVLLLAPTFRVNPLVGIPFVWVSNPLTMVPIYFANYWVGNKLLNIFAGHPALTYTEVTQRLGSFGSISHFLSNFYTADFWHKVITLLAEFGLDLWVGSLIVGLAVALLTYIVSYRFIVWYRTHKPVRLRRPRKRHSQGA